MSGNNADYGEASIAVKNNVFYVSGTTHSKDFPTTLGAFQTNKTHNGDTPYMLAFENMCFLPDATDIVANPNSSCGFSSKNVLFKAKPRQSNCILSNSLAVKWRILNGLSETIVTGDSVKILVGPSDKVFVYVLDTISNCKSADVNVKLNFGGIRINHFKSICNGDSILLQKKYRKVSGIYLDTIYNTSACDTVISTQLDVVPYFKVQKHIDICPGGSFSFNAKTYSIAGIYVDTITSFITCDSIFTIYLRIIPFNLITNIRICSGKTYRVGTNIYNSSGIYIDSLKNYLGCDSIITTNLQVLSRIEDTLIGNYCNGDVVFIGKNMYNVSGNYRDTMKSFGGCDSFMTSYLHFSPSIFYEDTVNYCERDSFFVLERNMQVYMPIKAYILFN
ncbi:MAG: hypothetical protein IPK03_09520 [Bacteroidetes bacterium]|nr:hypothetical protein [Bacteroidota bacterium]